MAMEIDKRDILRYVGDTAQLFGIEEFTYNSGKARGIRAAHVRNGSGLEYTVLADRCMDIGRVSYNGCNIAYFTPVGLVSPQYYEKEGLGFLRSFTGGGVTTCGFTHFGAPCEDQGEQLGLHGIATSLPAEEFGAHTKWDKVPAFELSGRMRESMFFGENIILQRNVTSKYGDDSIYIDDCFTNEGFSEQPFMFLYHVNIGYPIVQKESYLLYASREFECASEESARYQANMYKCMDPTEGFTECVYFHKMKPVEDGKTVCAIVNPKLGLGVAVWSDVNELGRATQWNVFGKGNYVVGLSQGNAHGKGRAAARADGTLQFIQPGQTKKAGIRIEILHDADRIQYIKDICK